MPELSEEICEDSKLPAIQSRTFRKSPESATDICKVEAASECPIRSEGEVKWEGREGESKQRKSSILSDSMLRALGLKKGEGELVFQQPKLYFTTSTNILYANLGC